MLFGLAALDELSSGVPGVAAADLERTFGTTHAVLTLAIFLGPGVIALVVEPLLFLLADRYPRRWFVRGGLAAMAIGAWLAALASGPVTFALALSVLWIASGTATGIAQAMLVDQFSHERGRTLARWSMWSLAGDLAAPGLLAALTLAGAGWRAGFAIVGGVIVICLLALIATEPAAAPPASSPEQAEPQPSLWAALRDALRDRLLIAWLFGCALCDLLDEILVVFASIHLRVDLQASPLWQSAAIAALVIGGAVGLVACDLLLKRRSERWVLVASCIGTAVTYVPWLAAPTPLVSTLLFALVGACSAPLYALAAAQAYARKPEASGAVLAASHLFTPLGLALPVLVGTVADHAGTSVALTLLVAQPLGLVVLVAATRASRR
ncbi:MAG TPA: MFS transporter [Kofleriaceae bacterium]